jgi:hypothetical protein
MAHPATKESASVASVKTMVAGSKWNFPAGTSHSSVVDILSGATNMAATDAYPSKADLFHKQLRNDHWKMLKPRKEGGNPTFQSGRLLFICTTADNDKAATEWRRNHPATVCTFLVEFIAADKANSTNWTVRYCCLNHSCNFAIAAKRAKPLRQAASTDQGKQLLNGPTSAVVAGERKGDANRMAQSQLALQLKVTRSQIFKHLKFRFNDTISQHVEEFAMLIPFLLEYQRQDPQAQIDLQVCPLEYDVAGSPNGAVQFVRLSIVPGAMKPFMTYATPIDMQDGAHHRGPFRQILMTTVKGTGVNRPQLVVTHLSFVGRENQLNWGFHLQCEHMAKNRKRSELRLTDGHKGCEKWLTDTEFSECNGWMLFTSPTTQH